VKRLIFVLGIMLVAFGVAEEGASAAKAKSDYVVSVNGVKLSRGEFDRELKRKLELLKSQIPEEQLKRIKPEVEKQIREDFIIRQLLTGEVERLKITASEKEIQEAMEQVKSSLPPGVTLEVLMKQNGLNQEDIKKELALGVKINKLVLSQPLAKGKPTDKEIVRFYKENQDKFKLPETVHARHILIAKHPGDDEKQRTEKKTKAETIRKQLIQGADFADLAAKHSDDISSKKNGGDLGTFRRGQMVKSFEDAAFSQKVKEIGPVVETEYGYHIIQVVQHNPPKIIELDSKVKGEIAAFLMQEKRQEAFAQLVKKLRAKATIIVPGN